MPSPPAPDEFGMSGDAKAAQLAHLRALTSKRPSVRRNRTAWLVAACLVALAAAGTLLWQLRGVEAPVLEVRCVEDTSQKSLVLEAGITPVEAAEACWGPAAPDGGISLADGEVTVVCRGDGLLIVSRKEFYSCPPETQQVP